MPGYESPIEVVKADEDQHLIYGWASVIMKNGQPVIDSQDDIIEESVLQKAAHDFISNARKGDFMHHPSGLKIGEIVESMVFTKSLQDAMGIVCKNEKGEPIVGWFFCMKVLNNNLWQEQKIGNFKEFSIGGSGVRVKID